MTLAEFKTQIRSLGAYTNIQCTTMYQRYMSGTLDLDQIASNPIALPCSSALSTKKTVLKPERLSTPYIRLHESENLTVLGRLKRLNQAYEEDSVLLMFKERDFITSRIVINELHFSRQCVSRTLKRLEAQGVLIDRQAGRRNGCIHIHVLAPVEVHS